ncbi:hypothetical protein HYU07_00460 [Candidatus Woesearchaeota archaeon]|nr:hypothetical protein [Candidatus Woesearchaeota archaeon]
MKPLFEWGDITFGIISGALLIATTGIFLNIPNAASFLPISLILFIISAILNLAFNFKDMHKDKKGFLASLHGIIDIILSIALLSVAFGLDVPFSAIFQDPNIRLGIGIFFIAANVLWLFVE